MTRMHKQGLTFVYATVRSVLGLYLLYIFITERVCESEVLERGGGVRGK